MEPSPKKSGSTSADVIRVEKIEPGTVCVWCWQEITNDQAALEVGESAVAHLGCDNRMLKFIDSLKGYLND